MAEQMIISAAVEGDIDEAAARKLVTAAGAALGPVYGKRGKNWLLNKLGGFNNAARFSPWLVLIDLDGSHRCAPDLVQGCIGATAGLMCLRVAVTAVEAWLLADRSGLAAFLRVPVSQIPANPEAESDPKVVMVNLARQSASRDIREDMVPTEGSGRRHGPAYVSRLVEFIGTRWDPQAAALHAPSLGKALACLQRLVESAAPG